MPAAHWEEVLEFWFGDVTSDPLRNRALWFSASPATDALMRERFLPLVLDAEAGRLDAWREDPHGCLALILLTDQFPRNIFRGKPDAFRFDAYALELSHHAREAGYDRILHPVACVFLYLPLEHAEDLAMQELSVKCFVDLEKRATDPTVAEMLTEARRYADLHYDIIRRFGRYPHRNAVLGRQSTPEEIAYLEGGAERFGQ